MTMKTDALKPIYVSSSRIWKPGYYQIKTRAVEEENIVKIAITVLIDNNIHVGHVTRRTCFVVAPEDYKFAMNQLKADLRYGKYLPHAPDWN